MRTIRFVLGTTLLSLCVAGCSGGKAIVKGPAEWVTTRDTLIEEYLKAHPVFAVFAGRHEYDGQLPDWSASGIAVEIRRLKDARTRLLAMPNSALTDKDRFERDYFAARMTEDLFWLETAQAPFRNPAWYLDWGLDPAPYLTRSYAPLEVRMRAYAQYAKSVQKVIS